MKKIICMLLALVLLFSLSACGPKEYDVELRVENLSAEAEDVAVAEKDFEITLTADELYKLPQSVEVIIDGQTLDSKDYSYDSESGKLEIPGEQITGDVEIKASAELISYEVITPELSGISVQGDAQAYPKQNYKTTLVAQEYYQLPETVAVVVNGTELEATDYTYDALTGELVITGDINGEVNILGEATPVVYELNTEKIIGLTVSYETEEAPSQVAPAFGYNATLTAAEGNNLPENVEVLVDGNALDASAYTWDALTGVLEIPGASITGAVEIRANAVPVVVGKWVTTVDLTEYLNNNMVASDPTMAAYFNFENLNMTVYFTFNEDGTGGSEADKESVEAMLESLKEGMIGGFKVMLQELLDAQGIPMTVDEYLAAAGLDLEDMFDDSMNVEDMGLDDLSGTGFYMVEGNKLFMFDEDGLFDEKEYFVFSMKDGNLIFEAVGNDPDGMGAYVLPLVLTPVAD